VIIGARVSKSANASPQPGDLQGSSAPVKVGAKSVSVVIDTSCASLPENDDGHGMMSPWDAKTVEPR